MGLLDARFGNQYGGLSKNDNGTLRVGNRMPSDTAPKGEIIGDLWYDTSVSSLKVWNGSTWVGAASGVAIITPGFEIYHPANTPYIDFHRAANPAGDSNADFNVRFINDADNVMRLSTLSAADSTTGGRYHIGNAVVGSHPVHGPSGWAVFGHQNRLSASDYQYLANSNGEIILNSGGSTKLIRFLIDGSTELGNFTTTRCRFPNKISVGPNDFTDPEPITLTGGASGISYRDRSDNNQRWVTYTTTSNFYFWDGTTERALIERTNGRIQASLGFNGTAIHGQWTGSSNYSMFNNLNQIQNNQENYALLHGHRGVDNRTYLNGPVDGEVRIRRGGNQALDMRWDNVPNINGPFVRRDDGSQQVGRDGSSMKLKENIRTLKETEDPDSGENNPVFQLRPVRFNWKHCPEGKNGLINGNKCNERNPNGVVGLLAEEVLEVCPDAVFWTKENEEEPWDVKKGGLAPIDPETGERTTVRKAQEKQITSLDNDRLVAYLIDAVQHLKEEIETLKEQVV